MNTRWSILPILVLVALPAVPVHGASGARVLITAVYPDTYVSGEGDEFVRLTNVGDIVADLSNWIVRDSASSCSSSEGSVKFPSGASLAPGASAFVTQDASKFRLDMIVAPQWEWLVDSDAAVPQLTRPCGRFVLSNAGDEVLLLDAAATVQDAVAYGTSAYAGAGWTGAAVAAPHEGTILERDTDEGNGAFSETHSAADWDDLRRYNAGQTHFQLEKFATEGDVTAFTSPDSTYGVLQELIERATVSIHLELYELTSLPLGEALAARAEAGVDVRILMEGGPAGMAREDRDQQNWILAHIQAAGGDVRYLFTNSTQGVHARYTFQHGKFGVFDDATALVMSGNWKPTGTPSDPTSGNREWGVLVRDAGVAAYLDAVLDDDSDFVHRDVLAFGAGDDWRYLPPAQGFTPNASVPAGPYVPFFPARTFNGAMHVTPILSPDTSLLQTLGLTGAIRNAHSEVLVEQMYAHKHWGSPAAGTPAADPDVYLEAAIDAARNGARVRVLLGDEFIDHSDSRNNQDTVDYLNDLAATEGLDLQGRIVDSRVAAFTKIHNKGVVIDGATTFVGSLNWGLNSAQENREVGLLLENAQLASFYRDVFWYDWAPREFKPLSDLTVTGVTFTPEASMAGGVGDPTRGHVTVTVANVGHYGAGPVDVDVTLHPTLYGPVTKLDRVTLPFLGMGETHDVVFPWDTTLSFGSFTTHATVDMDDAVRETDETNNALSTAVQVVAPAPGVDLSSPPTLG